MPQAAPLTKPDAATAATTAMVALPAEQAAASATADTRSEEQRKKDERRQYLENESIVYCPNDGFSFPWEYAPEFAISLIILGFLFIVTDKRKPTERKGWRAWLRGRF